MVEYIGPQEGFLREGHHPNTEYLVLELHRLLAMFLASKSFAALRTGIAGETYDPIYQIQAAEEDELPLF